MATLADIIKQNMQKLQGTTAPQMTDESERAASLLRARGGKAITGGTTPRRSAQLELSQQPQDISGEVALATAGIEQQQEQLQQSDILARESQAQSRSELEQRSNEQYNRIMDELESSKAELGAQKNRSKLEQAGFIARLNNREYIDRLQREGETQRLDNEIVFKEKLQSSILGNSEKLLSKQLGNRRLMDMDEREFQREMAKMDIDTAIALMRDEISAANKRQIATGIGSMAAAGASAMADYKPSNELSSGKITEGVDNIPSNQVVG